MASDTIPSGLLVELADDDPEALLRVYAERGWGDGLPMVAPTAARVEAMLAALGDVDPDEVLAVLPPRFGEVTRRIVAVNAVLAGCRPSTWPVVVSRDPGARPSGGQPAGRQRHHAPRGAAADRARRDRRAGRLQRRHRRVRAGALQPGQRHHRAGRPPRAAARGRGGARAGRRVDPGRAGQVHVLRGREPRPPPRGRATRRSRGVDAASAVTVHCGEAPHNFHDMESDHPAHILEKCASAMATMGQNNMTISQGEYFVALGPEHAATAAAHGWTRRDIASYLFERARLPMGVVRANFHSRAWAPWVHSIADDDLMPMTAHPDNIRVFVCGGPGKHSCVIPSWGMTASVTLARRAVNVPPSTRAVRPPRRGGHPCRSTPPTAPSGVRPSTVAPSPSAPGRVAHRRARQRQAQRRAADGAPGRAAWPSAPAPRSRW